MNREGFLQRYTAGQRDFTRADLHDIDLSGVDLSMGGNNFDNGVIFYQADLANANFRGANLSKAYFECANLVDADFTGANLESANLDGTNLTDACLREANVTAALFGGGANLSGADMTNAQGGWLTQEGGCFKGTTFPDGTVEGIDDTSYWGVD